MIIGSLLLTKGWQEYRPFKQKKYSYIYLKSFKMVLVLKKGASKKQIKLLEKKIKLKAGVDVIKYCGSIKLKTDALEIQKSLRNEWQ